ncbi:hypothetical protein [Veillonella caviae]|uniref:hypothetical protein n=1 Tax=Veillonella caviae TaxID=248316 RepID=UPI002A9206E6|nr:hypothetical protein [Veillonella caviae]MDY5408518.1 hypothetical protein [Veillonella caviae]
MNRTLIALALGIITALGLTGCGVQQQAVTHDEIMSQLPDKTKASLERSNDPKEIDKEFRKRFEATQKNSV